MMTPSFKKINSMVILGSTLLACITALAMTANPEPAVWATYAANAAHTSYIPMQVGDPNTFRVLWHKQFFNQGGNNYVSQVVTTDTHLYFTDIVAPYYALYAVDAETGKVVWQDNLTGLATLNGPAYADGKVFLQKINGGEKGTIIAYVSQNGKQLYEAGNFDSQFGQYYAPTPYKNFLYYSGGQFGGVNAAALDTGSVLWRNNLGTDFDSNYTTPAVNDDDVVIYAVNSDNQPTQGWLEIINKANGTLEHKFIDQHAHSISNNINSAPALDNAAHVAAMIQSDYLTLYDLQNDSVMYSIGAHFTGQPSIDTDQHIIYAINNNLLVAINEKTGQQLWSWAAPNDERLTGFTPIITKQYIFISSDKNTYAIDKIKHTDLWHTQGSGLLILNHSMLYIVNRDTADITAIDIL